MTSANVTEYTIYDKDHKEVGHHRQNHMCSTCNDGLEKFQPASDFTIEAWGYDEEEELWSEEDEEGNSIEHNLQDWLVKHPASFTSRVFQYLGYLEAGLQSFGYLETFKNEDGILEVTKNTIRNNSWWRKDRR